jgi:hypothetical protein
MTFTPGEVFISNLGEVFISDLKDTGCLNNEEQFLERLTDIPQ